jgi:hypothetical protein
VNFSSLASFAAHVAVVKHDTEKVQHEIIVKHVKWFLPKHGECSAPMDMDGRHYLRQRKRRNRGCC